MRAMPRRAASMPTPSERLGMTPSAWRDGGRGETIRYVVADSPLGPLLVAATPKGICRLTFDEDESALRRRFPNADIRPDDGTIAAWVEGALAAIDAPLAAPELPIDVRGTAFQEAVWQELRKHPARRDAQLCRHRRGGRRARRGARGRDGQWLEPGRGAGAVPPRDPLATARLAAMPAGSTARRKLLAAEGAMIPQPDLL